MCRDQIGKAKTQSELNLARDAKHKKNFYKYVVQKRKVKEISLPTSLKSLNLKDW